VNTPPVFLLPLALALATPALAQDAPKRPNIVVLFADDHAQAATGCYGSVLNDTPAIDKLAARGVRFTRSFVTNSICGPSRATFLTGTHSHTNGKVDNRSKFRDDLPSLPKSLDRAGYRTAVVGKWHLPTDPNGFDDWMVVHGGYYSPVVRTAKGREARNGHCTTLITDEAVQWLGARAKEASSEPFFLWVSYKAAHRTWDPGPEQLELYRGATLPEPATLFDDYATRSPAAAAAQMRISTDLFPAYDLKLPATGEGILDRQAINLRARMPAEVRKRWNELYGPENAAFAAADLEGAALVRWNYQRYIQDYLRCVAGIDASVARITAQLDALGLRDDTIIVYTSDQGFFLGEHGWYDKRWMYEPSFATPLIVDWPGKTKAGTEVDALVQNLDLAPTLLAAAGVEVPDTMQGESLVPFFDGGAPERWRDAVYYHYQQRDQGRTSHTVAPHYGVRTARHKLMHLYDTDDWELYDLERDPDEVRNLADDPAHAELRAALTQKLQQLRAQFADTTGKALRAPR